MLTEPLDAPEAQKLMRQILKVGTLSFSGHGLREMAKDSIQTTDAVNVIRAGFVEGCEERDGSWRYRVRTQLFYVVVAFRSETHLRVVTAWRLRR